MLLGDHPDWPRVLAAFCALPPNDAVDRDIWAGVGDSTLRLAVKVEVSGQRFTEERVAALAHSIAELVTRDSAKFLLALRDMIETARVFPEVRDALKAGEVEKACMLAGVRGVDDELFERLLAHRFSVV